MDIKIIHQRALHIKEMWGEGVVHINVPAFLFNDGYYAIDRFSIAEHIGAKDRIYLFNDSRGVSHKNISVVLYKWIL